MQNPGYKACKEVMGRSADNYLSGSCCGCCHHTSVECKRLWSPNLHWRQFKPPVRTGKAALATHTAARHGSVCMKRSLSCTSSCHIRVSVLTSVLFLTSICSAQINAKALQKSLWKISRSAKRSRTKRVPPGWGSQGLSRVQPPRKDMGTGPLSATSTYTNPAQARCLPVA